MICNLSCLTAMQKLHLSRKKNQFYEGIIIKFTVIYIVFWILIFFKVIKNICNFYQPILWNYNLCKLCINISVDQEGRKNLPSFR